MHYCRLIQKNYYLIVYCFLFFSCGGNKQNIKTNTIQSENFTKKFVSKEGQFQILFEDEPTKEILYIPFENGEIQMNCFIYEKGVNLIFCISYVDYPESFMNNKNPEEVLNNLLETYINTQKAGLETKKMILVNAWPGIYYKANNSDTFVMGEYILRKNRLYQLTVTKEGNYHSEPEANSFFQSLELL